MVRACSAEEGMVKDRNSLVDITFTRISVLRGGSLVNYGSRFGLDNVYVLRMVKRAGSGACSTAGRKCRVDTRHTIGLIFYGKLGRWSTRDGDSRSGYLFRRCGFVVLVCGRDDF